MSIFWYRLGKLCLRNMSGISIVVYSCLCIHSCRNLFLCKMPWTRWVLLRISVQLFVLIIITTHFLIVVSRFTIAFVFIWMQRETHKFECNFLVLFSSILCLFCILGRPSKQDRSQARLDSIKVYFTTTPGIGGFETHVIILHVPLCVACKLLSFEDFKQKFIEPIFGSMSSSVEFAVVTSHNVNEFLVPFVVIWVNGSSKYRP